jgi:hypothetical protein
MTNTISRLTKKDKQAITARAVAAALADYFGDVTKVEAEEVFKVLAMMAPFPGATPPEPLVGCDVLWSSELRVGDSLASQKFSVQVKYRKLFFNYSNPGDGVQIRGIQLPDSSHINFDNWDLHADRVEKRAIANIKF